MAYRHLELELVVATVGSVPAHVEIHTGGAQTGPGNAPVDGLLFRAAADAHGALLEDGVLHRHFLVVIQPRRHGVDELPDHLFPALGEIRRDAADPEPGRVHAAAGDGLNDAEQPLPVGEHVEHRRHLPDVLGEGAVEDQVAGDAEQLR